MEKSVILPGIEVSLPLPRGIDVRFDGTVPSIPRHISRTVMELRGFLYEERHILDRFLNRCVTYFALQALRDKLGELDDLHAYCFEHSRPNGSSLYVIAKRAGLNPSEDAFADGHESCELLQRHNIARQDLLQKELERESVDVNSAEYRGEDFADLGGLLVLCKQVRRGVSLTVPAFKSHQAFLDKMAPRFGF